MDWKTVYVFVSSTFNDMHAERDRLVKRVFPELRLWCARRKLQLREIDLRWGVSAADAQENKRVVEVCLRNVDRCRPFFLCFMGQRRGWVPDADDINPETLARYPALKDYVGKASVTEMEILHALLNPMTSGSSPVRHARFYFREDSYVKNLKSSAHKELFVPKRSLFRNSDKATEAFKKQLSRRFCTVSYSARWNPDMPSPELTGELSKGRLEDFRTENGTLEADVLEWLKTAIEAEFPEHRELPEETDPLEQELDRQDTQCFYSADGYISRPVEEQALAEHLEAAGTAPLYLVAEAGCGKTSLLADFINKYTGTLYYRFVGTTPQSFRLEDLSNSLINQWVRDGLLEKTVLEYPAAELTLMFPYLCVQAAQKQPFLLVLDGMDQLLGGEKWLNWLPKIMPAGASLLVSLRSDSITLPEHLTVHRLGLMTDPKDKAMMASSYLNGFLKDIDEEQLGRLLEMKGSCNPLFMKIVLNELRQHGSFDTLMELFRKDFGSTPLNAFRQVLERVEQELKDTFFDPQNAILLFLLALANARRGLDRQIFLWGSRSLKGWEETTISDRQVLDLIYGLAQELEPYLVQDGGSFALRYDSFRRAIQEFYGPEGNRLANVMLTIAFQRRLYESHALEDGKTVLEHVTQAQEGYVHAFFTNPYALLQVLRYAGAELTAKACSVLVRQRKMPEFGDLESVLNKGAGRLNANPNTLFMELKRYGDPANPITAALLEQGKAVDTGVMLWPRYELTAADTMRWEFSFRKPNFDGTVWTAPWYVTIAEDTLWVMDLAKRETVNLMHLPRNRKYRLAALGEELFLCSFSEKYETIQISRYRLPELALLDQGPVMDCDHGNPWRIHGWDGHIYALQFSSVPDSKDGRYTLSCLDSGTVLFREEFPETIQYALQGGWFIYRDSRSGDTRVLSLRDGSCQFCDRFLGTDHLDPGLQLSNYSRLFANTANLHVGYDKALYILLSGSRITTGGQPELVKKLLRLLPDGEALRLDRVWDRDLTLSRSFNVIDGRFLISESEGLVTVVDPDAGTTQKMKLGQSNTELVFDVLEDQLLLFFQDKVRSYDLDAFLAALKPDLEERFVGGRSTVIDKGFLYVMDTEMERVDLKTLELTKEADTGWQNWEIYAPWNMMGEEYWIGWSSKTGRFSIKSPGKMARVAHLSSPNPDRQEVRHGFLYKDQKGERRIGLVIYEKKTATRIYKGKPEQYAAVKYLTKPFWKMAEEGGWEELDLFFEMPLHNAFNTDAPFSVTANGKPYLVLYNEYLDEETTALRIFDVWADQYIHTVKMNGRLTEMSFQRYPGGFLVKYNGRRESFLYAVNLEKLKALRINQDLNILTKDQFSTTVCLVDRNTREVSVFDTQTHEQKKVTIAEDDFWPTGAVVTENAVILTRSFEDEIRIYDRNSGARLGKQQLELAPQDLMYDETTGMVVMVDSKCRKHYWTLEAWKKPEP